MLALSGIQAATKAAMPLEAATPARGARSFISSGHCLRGIFRYENTASARLERAEMRFIDQYKRHDDDSASFTPLEPRRQAFDAYKMR